MILKRDSQLLDLEHERDEVIAALAGQSLSTAENDRLQLRLAELEDAIEAIPAKGPDGLMVKWRYFLYWHSDGAREPGKAALVAFEKSLHRVVGTGPS